MRFEPSATIRSGEVREHVVLLLPHRVRVQRAKPALIHVIQP